MFKQIPIMTIKDSKFKCIPIRNIITFENQIIRDEAEREIENQRSLSISLPSIAPIIDEKQNLLPIRIGSTAIAHHS